MLVRQHANKQSGNAKLWVSEAVAREDKMFDKPLWRGERTPGDESDERLRRIKILRKHGNKDVRAVAISSRLEYCELGKRCLSGACPECGHLLQRWFVRRSKPFIADYLEKPGTDLVAVSIIPIKSTAHTGKLEKISAANCLRRLKYALQQAGIKVAIGGMDFSFNEDAKGKYKSFWSQHYYIITYALDLNKLKKALKKYFWDTEAVPRPVKISPFENKPRRRSYPLKTIFKRRIGYKAIRTDKSGRKRKCRNTRRDRLRSKERFELFIYLNKIGLASRVIFVGATPISDASGVSVARRRSRNQNKQPRIAEQTWR
jgi:hypothetical protein